MKDLEIPKEEKKALKDIEQYLFEDCLWHSEPFEYKFKYMEELILDYSEIDDRLAAQFEVKNNHISKLLICDKVYCYDDDGYYQDQGFHKFEGYQCGLKRIPYYIEEFTQLEELYIYGNLRDLPVEIKNMHNLHSIYIMEDPNAPSVYFSNSILKREGLKIHYMKYEEISKYYYQKKNKDIKYVTIRGKYFDILNNTLNLMNQGITHISEIKGLEELEMLKKLDLGGNNITKITDLESLKNLESLNLSNNQISKIEGIDNLKYIHHLILANNKISEISGLEYLKRLQQLVLEGNPLPKQLLDELGGVEYFAGYQNVKKPYNFIHYCQRNSKSWIPYRTAKDFLESFFSFVKAYSKRIPMMSHINLDLLNDKMKPLNKERWNSFYTNYKAVNGRWTKKLMEKFIEAIVVFPDPSIKFDARVGCYKLKKRINYGDWHIYKDRINTDWTYEPNFDDSEIFR